MERRRALVLVLGIALGAVGISLLLRASSPGDEEAAPLPARSSPTASEPEHLSAPAMAAAPGTSSSAREVSSRESADVDDPWPSVTVLVVDAEGQPRQNATVYAVPAGGPGTDERFAALETDMEGRARLRVPRPGRYDVGALAYPYAIPVAKEIEFPSSAVVRLVLPALAPVTFHVAPEVPLPPGGTRIVVLPVGDDPRHIYPGRGERTSIGVEVALSPTGGTGFFPTDGDFAPPFQPAPTAIEPERFRAPAEVHWIVRYPYRLVVLPRVDADAPAPPFDAQFRLAVEGDGLSPSIGTLVWDARAGESPGARDPTNPLRIFAARPSTVLRWSGPGIERGSLDVSGLEREKETVVRLPIRIREFLPVPRSQPQPPTRRVEIEIEEGFSTESIQVLSDASSLGAWDAEAGRGVWDVDAATSWVLAVGGDSEATLVGGPVRMDPVGRTRLALRRGGHLVLVPRRLPPDGLDATLVRSDGLPMCFDFESKDSIPLSAGRVIGPLEPGRVAFRIRVGGVDFGEVSATVVAGENRALEIGDLTPR